jgi:hypothetical protein
MKYIYVQFPTASGAIPVEALHPLGVIQCVTTTSEGPEEFAGWLGGR